MNMFFDEYVDITAILLTLLLPLVFTIIVKKRVRRNARSLPAYFLFFGPSGILVFIFFHLLENSYRAVDGALAGTFVYSFRFYSLILLGVVVALLGYLLLRACLRKCLSEVRGSRELFVIMLLVAMVSAPLVPIIPIAAVPVICCVLSLVGLPFVRRRIARAPVIGLNRERAVRI